MFSLQPYFFKAFELPVHPQYLVNRLEDLCIQVKGESFLHLALKIASKRPIQAGLIEWRIY